MLRSTNQVQQLQRLPEFCDLHLKQLSEQVAKLERALSEGNYQITHRLPLFPKMVDAKRKYPGEAAGVYLSWYLENMRPSVARTLLKKMRPIMRFESTIQKTVMRFESTIPPKELEALKRAQRKLIEASEALRRVAMNGRLEFESFTPDGLLVRPGTLRGLAASAVLGLSSANLLNRLRRCTHCGAWFYARFGHQQFCNDPKKRCQWNHYHTPEWRKQHREQNRKHQRAFRQRVFGKRRN